MRLRALVALGTANGAETVRRLGLCVLPSRYGHSGLQRRCANPASFLICL